MSRPVTTQVSIIAGVANGAALAQQLFAGNLALNLNGSLAVNGAVTFDAARRVVIASNGNDSGITFTITGTPRAELGNGATQTETIAGTNGGIAQSTQDFLTVSRITASAPTASTVTAGTNGVASGPWVVWDQHVSKFEVSCAGFVLSGNPAWGVEYTYDDPFGTWQPAGVPFPRALPLQSLIAENATAEGNIVIPVRASRLTLAAFGSAQLVQTQQGP